MSVGTFVVVACGFEPARLASHGAHASVLRLPDPLAPDFLERGRQLLADQGDEVPLVLLHAGRREQVRKVGMLRALGRNRSVVGLGVVAPPTGLAARATWLATFSERRVPAGLAIGHIQRHASTLPTFAVINSVAGVDLPCVKLRHHAMSWIPGRVFGIVLDGSARIASGASPGARIEDDDYDRIVNGNEALESKIDFSLPPIGETLHLPKLEGVAPWWGRAQCFEQTLVPRNIVQTMGMISRERFGRCSQCGEVASGSCPFCCAREEMSA